MTNKPPTQHKHRILADTLDFREITRSAADDTMNTLVEKEGVHPFTASNRCEELKTKRLAPSNTPGTLWDKHCFGLFERGKSTPELAVYVKLLHIEPDAQGNIPSEKLPGNIGEILASDVGSVVNPNVAIFYTITNAAMTAEGKPDQNHPVEVLRSTAGRTGGNELIVKVAEHLSNPPYNIKAFSTLSPMRSGKGEKANGFRQWLERELSEAHGPQTILTEDEAKRVRAIGVVAENESLYDGLSQIIQLRSRLKPDHQAFIEGLMTDLGTYYVAHERKAVSPKEAKNLGFTARLKKRVSRQNAQEHETKKVQVPLDNVTGFHIGNGAELANVHWVWPKQSTESDMQGAFGLMVNYRYYPAFLDQRKGNFRREGVIRLSPALAERYYERLTRLLPIDAWQDNHCVASLSELPNHELVLPNPGASWQERVANGPLIAQPACRA